MNTRKSIYDEAEKVLERLLASKSGNDAELRRELSFWVRQAMSAGMHLELSETSSPLGKLMAVANDRSKKLGWL